MIYTAAQSHLIVDEHFLIPGGIGIIVTAILYGTITKWGFFKQRWITVKWILTVTHHFRLYHRPVSCQAVEKVRKSH